MLLVYRTTHIIKFDTFFESLSSHQAVPNTSVFTDVCFKIAVALLGQGVDAASDLEFARLVYFGLVKVLQVKVIHTLNFI